ncbi:MAG: sugar transferase [Planctomycetes bacterium]|nr:sugar transferase [Planctomycetota bacterium]
MKSRRLLASAAFALFELLVTAGVFFVAAWLRERMRLDVLRGDFQRGSVLGLLPAVAVLWLPLLWRFGVARSERTDRVSLHLLRAIAVVAIGGILLLAFTFVRRQFDVSRAFLALFLGMNLAALSMTRVVASAFRLHARKRGYDRAYVLVAGTGKRARDHAARLAAHAEWGIEVVGFVAERPIALDTVAGRPVLGTLERLESILRGRVIDEVHFAVSRGTLERVDHALRVCDEIGVRTRFVLDLFGELKSRVYLERIEGVPLLTFSTTPHDETALLAKRVFDIVVSAVALAASGPVLLIAAALIKATSRGPVFFRQKRSGMNGRVFSLYKLRTMVQGADAMKAQLEAKNEMDGPVFKMKDDPRVTAVGRWLRKLSIDELPQLYNVLRGDMSIVGPRPPVPGEVEKYERWQRRRLSMRPGITCIWQVSGRNQVSFRRWMEMDLEYIDNWSLLLDFKIILRTIPAVLSSRGAS